MDAHPPTMSVDAHVRPLFHERAGNPFGVRAVATGVAAFFLLVGSLGLAAFALPVIRLWALYAIAFLLIAWEVGFWIAGRVLDRRD